MNWFTLLKQPELRTGSKVTTNLGIDSKEEEDDCERKIREYANKLQKMYMKLTDIYTDELIKWEEITNPETIIWVYELSNK